MISDKQKFEKLQQYEGGLIKLANNDGENIINKGIVKRSYGRIILEEVLFMIGLKHNLFSVS